MDGGRALRLFPADGDEVYELEGSGFLFTRPASAGAFTKNAEFPTLACTEGAANVFCVDFGGGSLTASRAEGVVLGFFDAWDFEGGDAISGILLGAEDLAGVFTGMCT